MGVTGTNPWLQHQMTPSLDKPPLVCHNPEYLEMSACEFGSSHSEVLEWVWKADVAHMELEELEVGSRTRPRTVTFVRLMSHEANATAYLAIALSL